MSILSRLMDRITVHLAAVMDSTDDTRNRYEPGLAAYAEHIRHLREDLDLTPASPDWIVKAWDSMSDAQRAKWGRHREEAANE